MRHSNHTKVLLRSMFSKNVQSRFRNKQTYSEIFSKIEKNGHHKSGSCIYLHMELTYIDIHSHTHRAHIQCCISLYVRSIFSQIYYAAVPGNNASQINNSLALISFHPSQSASQTEWELTPTDIWFIISK